MMLYFGGDFTTNLNGKLKLSHISGISTLIA